MATNSSTSDVPRTSPSDHIQWMKDLPENLHDQPLTKIAIPGTHDSFAFELTSQPGPDLAPTLRYLRVFIQPIIRNWSITQDKTFTEQLLMGIRYFDLRVCRTREKNFDSRTAFAFTHGLLGHFVRDRLEEINEFLKQHPSEIVLLDFNHFYDFNDERDHDQLIHLIHEVFGTKLCTTARTIEECTLNYLWSHQQQVILLYEKNADQCTAYMDRIGHFFKVCESPWPNTPHIDNLFEFLDQKVSQPRPTTCVNVIQGQTTPDGGRIQSNPFSSLHNIARETNGRLLHWLCHRQRDPSIINGVNVVICDFADQAFVDAVIGLNHKTSLTTHTT